jgi:hypothetical protein
MHISLNWLKELVDINMSPEELGRVLTIAGFELEELIDLRANADGVVVGKVIERSLVDLITHNNQVSRSSSKLSSRRRYSDGIISGLGSSPTMRRLLLVAIA